MEQGHGFLPSPSAGSHLEGAQLLSYESRLGPLGSPRYRPEPFIHSFIHCLWNELFVPNSCGWLENRDSREQALGGDPTGLQERRVPGWDQLEDQRQPA